MKTGIKITPELFAGIDIRWHGEKAIHIKNLIKNLFMEFQEKHKKCPGNFSINVGIMASEYLDITNNGCIIIFDKWVPTVVDWTMDKDLIVVNIEE